MDNDSAQVVATVTRNECSDCDQYERFGPPVNKSLGHLAGPHCTTCHENTHIACVACGACLPPRHRYDRRYCSSTCRVRTHNRREDERLARATWEAEQPNEARQQAEERQKMADALQGAGMAGNPERFRLKRELKATAERCAEHIWNSETKTFSDCAKNFGAGDVLYRRRETVSITSPVFSYCREHRCGQSGGYHNRDAPKGSYYTYCRCEERHWEEPEPCVGCSRLISHPKYAPWRRLRHWAYFGMRAPAQPRPFCSERCRRRVFDTERKAKRLAERDGDERQCAACRGTVNKRRADARYCSTACRQGAYRQRAMRATRAA